MNIDILFQFDAHPTFFAISNLALLVEGIDMTKYNFIICCHQLNKFPPNSACSRWYDVGDLIKKRLILVSRRPSKKDDMVPQIGDEEYAVVAEVFNGTSIRSQVRTVRN